MKTVMFEVRWQQRDWTATDQSEVVTHHRSPRFIALRVEDAYLAAKAVWHEMRMQRHKWDDEHDIEVFNLRIVRITEEVI